MTDTRRIAVISAGLSTPSSTRMLADRLAAAAVAELGERGIEATAETFELRDHAHDIMNNLLAGFAPPALETVLTQVATADALIAVTPIFQAGYSGLFKSFVDVLDRDALSEKPVLIGANAGTARHSLAIDYAIRPLFAYLHAEPVSTGVFAASGDWGGKEDDVAPLSARIERGARELAEAIAAKPSLSQADPFDPDTYLGQGRGFGHLLGGLAGE
ncbi:FMN reductase [Microbacterium marinilacus]|uniref:FMN reductase n=1 Tax=Microbacterium marinilacus TaxID=415209 RepID=A0ABP7BPT3_9MICO|nr:FMN reductase [Microbacterium marinilacus]MBY0689880.1 FMN reductase [Microbacterium marinilacus]